MVSEPFCHLQKWRYSVPTCAKSLILLGEVSLTLFELLLYSGMCLQLVAGVA